MKVSTGKRDIDGQQEIAMCVTTKTESTYISESMTDIKISKANLRFLIT